MKRVAVILVVACSMFVGVLAAAKPPRRPKIQYRYNERLAATAIVPSPPYQCFVDDVYNPQKFLDDNGYSFSWSVVCSPKLQKNCNGCTASISVWIYNVQSNTKVFQTCSDEPISCGSVGFVSCAGYPIAGLATGAYQIVAQPWSGACNSGTGTKLDTQTINFFKSPNGSVTIL